MNVNNPFVNKGWDDKLPEEFYQQEEEVEEEAYEPQAQMDPPIVYTRTCAHFAPSKESVEQGAELPPNYRYDKAFFFNSCGCRTRNVVGKMKCGFDLNQTDCPYYQPSGATVVKKVKLTHQDSSESTITVTRSRHGESLPLFSVLHVNAGEEDAVVLANVDFANFGSKSLAEAQRILNEAIKELNVVTAEVIDVEAEGTPVEVKPKRSYISSLLSV